MTARTTAEIAGAHRDADAANGREWVCACGPCRTERGRPRETPRWDGTRLAKIRQARGMSQDHLARLVGTHRQRVTEWEGGVRTPGADNIIALARALGVSTDLLLLGEVA